MARQDFVFFFKDTFFLLIVFILPALLGTQISVKYILI